MADALDLRIGHYFDLTPGASATTFAIDAANKSLEYAYPSMTGSPITGLWVPPGQLTGVSPTYRISLQGQAGDGFADGVTKVAGAASGTFAATANAQWVNLTSSYTPTRGEMLSNVISYDSGTINVSNFAAFTRTFGGVSNPHVLYTSQNVGGTKSKFGGSPITYGYRTASQVYGAPINQSTGVNFSNATEVGGLFAIPTGWAQSVRVLGAIVFMNQQNGANLTLSLYQGGAVGDTTVATSVTHDGDWGVTGAERNWTFIFSSPVVVTAGDSFRLGLSSNVAGGTSVRCVDVIQAADLAAFPMGTSFIYSQRSGGNWTDTTTRRPCIQVILDDITPPSGGSSIVLPLGLNGGING